MENPIIRIHNSETNEVIDRQMTDEEFEQYEKDRAEDEARLLLKEEAKQKKAAAQAKLAALGLTVSDLEALGL
jgi:hypothetical protein